jgi:hypothetical protein
MILIEICGLQSYIEKKYGGITPKKPLISKVQNFQRRLIYTIYYSFYNMNTKPYLTFSNKSLPCISVGFTFFPETKGTKYAQSMEFLCSINLIIFTMLHRVSS